ncbi:MAG: SpoIIE family protein phosphatase [Bacteroidales bacterium]|nr:SpoIIE family protein phosphatase [Bacteroidales bacterium]
MSIKNKISLILLILTLAAPQVAKSQTDKYADAKKQALQMPNNKAKLEALDNITKVQKNIDTINKYANMMITLAKKLDQPKYIGLAHHYKAIGYSNSFNFNKSGEEYQAAIAIFDSINEKPKLGECYNNYANTLTRINDYNLASENYNKALHVFFELNDTVKITDVYRNMGKQCISFHLYETASSYYSNAFKLDSIAKDNYALSLDFYQSGKSDYYQFLDLDSLALLKSGFAKQKIALSLAEKTDTTKRCIAGCLEQLMLMYTSYTAILQGQQKQQMFDSAKYYYDLAYKYRVEIEPNRDHTTLEICQANFLNLEGKVEESKEKLYALERKFDQNPAKYNRYRAFLYRSMIWVLKISGNYKDAVEYSEKFKDVEEATYNREFAVKSTKASAEAEYVELIRQREENENEQKIHQEGETKRQRMVTIFFAICICLAGLLAFIIWKGLVRKRRNNELLAKQKAEISEKNNELKVQNQKIMSQRDEIMAQRDEIESQRSQLSEANTRITASIRYAQRIQTAAVPSAEMMKKIFGECMVFWRPLNIVSGDFYWATQTGKYKLITAADCTGHGVPGAFMSMLGVSTLNDIAAQKNIESGTITAAGILNELRDKIIAALKQSGPQRETQDGMDMAFCIIDSETNELQYAGANRPLWYIRNGELTEYKADRMPVGYHIRKNGPFTNHVIKIEKGDLIYMGSDGISDQFGGGENNQFKFGTKQLKELLVKISVHPFDEQKTIIETTIDNWRATEDEKNPAPQLDDQILLGLKF